MHFLIIESFLSLFYHLLYLSPLCEHQRSICPKSMRTWLLMLLCVLKWNVLDAGVQRSSSRCGLGLFFSCSDFFLNPPPSFMLLNWKDGCWFKCKRHSESLAVFLWCSRCHIEQAQQVCRAPFLWVCSTDVSGSIAWPCLTWLYTRFHHVLLWKHTLLSVLIHHGSGFCLSGYLS